MILAAGEGRRMAPLSARYAKPALPVLDEPLVLRLVRELVAQGVEGVAINTHTRPETLHAALEHAPLEVRFCHEPVLRGRGGGVLGARQFLEDSGPFLVTNGDMCMQLDLAALRDAQRRSGALVTLVLRDDPRKQSFGTIGYDAEMRVCRVTARWTGAPDSGSGLFTGVHLLEPRIFERMPQREAFDILDDVYIPMLREGEKVSVWLQPPEAIWWPVGSPAELLEVNLRALDRRLHERGSERTMIGEGAVCEGEFEPPLWIGAGARIERGARVGPRVVVGAGARVSSGTTLERSLLLPRSRPPAAALHGAIGWGREVWRDA